MRFLLNKNFIFSKARLFQERYDICSLGGKRLDKRFLSNATKMSKAKVLITRPDISKIALDVLKQYEVILWEDNSPIPRAELLARIPGVDGLFCTLTDKIDAEVITAAGSRLKVVATMSVGIDHLDIQTLREKNIKIGHTPKVLTVATAELIIALLLATSRRLIEANRAIYKGEWKAWSPNWMCGATLMGSTVGIVGLGRIGLQVAEYIKGFNVSRILYNSRQVKEEAAKFCGEKVSFDTLLKESDFVIVTIALTPETKALFDAKAFKKMKRTAIFINASRGEVVDQDALIEALKEGAIQAAGLDVTTPEPIPLDSELLKLDNCVILPHIGSAANDTREEMAKITAHNIVAVLNCTPDKMPAPYPS